MNGPFHRVKRKRLDGLLGRLLLEPGCVSFATTWGKTSEECPERVLDSLNWAIDGRAMGNIKVDGVFGGDHFLLVHTSPNQSTKLFHEFPQISISSDDNTKDESQIRVGLLTPITIRGSLHSSL
jgi:hypothetical protein